MKNITGILLTVAFGGILLTAAALLRLHPPGETGKTAILFLFVCGLCLTALPLVSLLRTSRLNRQLQRDCERLAAENENLRLAHSLAERRSRQLLDNAGDAIFFINPESGSLL